jgi:uncharacterized protein YcfJ
MKTGSQMISTTVLAALGVAVSSGALADNRYQAHGHHHERYHDAEYARVVDVDPIIRRVRVSSPQQDCWNEDRPVSSGPSRTEIRSTIVGGVIGAAVGHRISQRHHDPVAVIGGSLIGAAIGNSIGVSRAANRGEYRTVGYESVQRCQVSYRDEWAEQIDGYRVTYVYHGREYTTRLPYDPGPRIRVDANIQPVYNRY